MLVNVGVCLTLLILIIEVQTTSLYPQNKVLDVTAPSPFDKDAIPLPQSLQTQSRASGHVSQVAIPLSQQVPKRVEREVMEAYDRVEKQFETIGVPSSVIDTLTKYRPWVSKHINEFIKPSKRRLSQLQSQSQSKPQSGVTLSSPSTTTTTTTPLSSPSTSTTKNNLSNGFLSYNIFTQMTKEVKVPEKIEDVKNDPFSQILQLSGDMSLEKMLNEFHEGYSTITKSRKPTNVEHQLYDKTSINNIVQTNLREMPWSYQPEKKYIFGELQNDQSSSTPTTLTTPITTMTTTTTQPPTLLHQNEQSNTINENNNLNFEDIDQDTSLDMIGAKKSNGLFSIHGDSAQPTRFHTTKITRKEESINSLTPENFQKLANMPSVGSIINNNENEIMQNLKSITPKNFENIPNFPNIPNQNNFNPFQELNDAAHIDGQLNEKIPNYLDKINENMRPPQFEKIIQKEGEADSKIFDRFDSFGGDVQQISSKPLVSISNVPEKMMEQQNNQRMINSQPNQLQKNPSISAGVTQTIQTDHFGHTFKKTHVNVVEEEEDNRVPIATMPAEIIEDKESIYSLNDQSYELATKATPIEGINRVKNLSQREIEDDNDFYPHKREIEEDSKSLPFENEEDEIHRLEY